MTKFPNAIRVLFLACFTLTCSGDRSSSDEQPARASSALESNAPIVIRQVYTPSGLGLTGPAAFKYDFVELFNRGNQAVSLTGWSLQTTDSIIRTETPPVFAVYPLPSVILGPGQSFLVQGKTRSNDGAELPISPDLTIPTLGIEGLGTTMALVRRTTPLVCSSFCLGTSLDAVDMVSVAHSKVTAHLLAIRKVELELVGIEGSVTTSEGGILWLPTLLRQQQVPPPPHQSAQRKQNGFQDTNDNAADFVNAAPVLRNLASSCPANATDPRRAVPIDPTVPTTFATAIAPLYQGPNASQWVIAPTKLDLHRALIGDPLNLLDAKRLAVIQGRVLDETGTGLPCVSVEIPDAHRHGKTMTWADGSFAIVTNGGAPVTVRLARPGYITAHRTVDTHVHGYSHVGDVRLLTFEPGDPVSADATNITVIAGDVEENDGDKRQAVLFVPPGTSANIENGDGSITPIPSPYRISIKELTNRKKYGQDAMPASLPPQSAFTYAVSLSVGGAENQDVKFTKPIPLYVDNFLQFPVGTAVPFGRYDYKTKQWVGEPSGVVVEITGKDARGHAVVNPSIPGMPDDELKELGDRYPVGATLWRVTTDHFSIADLNWSWVTPEGAVVPNVPPPQQQDIPDKQQKCGSIIDCESQTLRERVPVAGTPYTLTYSSARQPGGFTPILIPVTENLLPSIVASIEVQVLVGGRVIKPTIPFPPPYLPYVHEFRWDGLDANGRPLQGSQTASVTVSHVYPGAYRRTPFFGSRGTSGDNQQIGVAQRFNLVLSRTHRVVIPRWDAAQAGLGGWNLDQHHGYDVVSGTLHLGDGTSSAGQVTGTTGNVAGTGVAAPAGENVRAATSTIRLPPANSLIPSNLVVGPDGSLYFTESYATGDRIRKITPNGILSTVAGHGTRSVAGNPDAGDGGPALQASFWQPRDLTIGPDGNLYIVDTGNHRIRVIGSDGIIRPFVGTGVKLPFPGSNISCRALECQLSNPTSIAFGPDGTAYIADHPGLSDAYIRVVRDGNVTTMQGRSGDFVDLAVSRDGTLYFSSLERIGRFDSEGGVVFIAGSASRGEPPLYGEGQSALLRSGGLSGARNLTIGPDGLPYVADSGHHVIRRITADGKFETIAGKIGVAGAGLHGRPLSQTELNTPRAFAFAADGTLYVADDGNQRIRSAKVTLAAATAIEQGFVSSADGRELYTFNATGHHVHTIDGITGLLKYAFKYDSAGLLTEIADREITDPARRKTIIERDAAGVPQAIVAPDGQRTTLVVQSGALREVTDELGGKYSFTYHPGRLLHQLFDPEINARNAAPYTFTFDSGRLVRDEDPLRHAQTLLYESVPGVSPGWRVTHKSQTDKPTAYETVRSSPTSVFRKTVGPNGLSSFFGVKLDGSAGWKAPNDQIFDAHAIRADGSSTYWSTQPDARFGQIVGKQVEFTAAGGPTRTTTRSRTMVIPAVPTSVTSFQEAESVNGGPPTVLEYISSSQTFTTTSPAGRKTFKVVDTRGRPTSVRIDGFAPTTFDYDPATGQVSKIKATHGTNRRETWLSYFPSGAPKGYLRSVESYFNPTVNPSTSPKPAEAAELALFFNRDALGRALSETLGTESTGTETTGFDWDANGNLAIVTPWGRPDHTQDFTFLNQLESYTAPKATPGSTPPGAQERTGYTYKPDREIDKITRPDTQTIQHGYDFAGRLQSITTPTGTTNYDYYPAAPASGPTPGTAPGRLKSVRGPYGVDVTLQYQGPLVTRATWSGLISGSVARSYDNDFETVTETVTGTTGTQAIAFGYDADNLITCASLTTCDPSATTALRIERSAANGTIETITLGSVTESYTYNGFGELESKTAKHGTTPLHTFTYDVPADSSKTRDSLGRIKTRTEVINGATQTTTYSYDGQGRLESANGAASEFYSYDHPNGNRSRATTPAGTVSSIVYDDQDRLKSYGTTTYDYTLNGELKTKTEPGNKITHYNYDVLGNLRSVTLPTTPATTIEYLVDGMGRRVARKANGTTKRWLYRNGLKPVAELDGSGALVSTFVYASNPITPDYMLRGGKTYRILTDQLGSPRLVINVADANDRPFSATYTAFGEATITGIVDFLPFGFAGGIYDPDTKLVRFGARDYDPSVGRWTAKDPILWEGKQANLYVYVGNDPVNFLDPTGREVATWFGGAVATAGGVAMWTSLVSNPVGWAIIAAGGAISIYEQADEISDYLDALDKGAKKAKKVQDYHKKQEENVKELDELQNTDPGDACE